ncbi:MAG: universal stress protein [Methanomicrobiaceae archaeon]|nr:universal stress protein [Methanomicrobiaceae archaeon]MDD5419335.1 universal stress protein [Methanomicrobiaceae archaeon]
MLDQILVAVDGSEASKKALEEALSLAEALHAEIHAVHVIEIGLVPQVSMNTEPIDAVQQSVVAMLEREADEILEEARRKAAARGIEIGIQKRWGHPGSEIVGAAEELGIDLIVIGSRGRSRIARILLGSVSSFVVEHASSAVMVARG